MLPPLDEPKSNNRQNGSSQETNFERNGSSTNGAGTRNGNNNNNGDITNGNDADKNLHQLNGSPMASSQLQDKSDQQQQQRQQQQQTEPLKRLPLVDEAELDRMLVDCAWSLPDLGLCVSGMAGRFPKSNSINEFESNLRQGRDMITDQDESRFACGLWGLPPRAGRLPELDRFDAEFFGFTNEEANYIDHQMRILYEVVYESILDAGVNPAELRGTNTGVFFGLHCNEFENALADDPNFKSNGYYAQFAVKLAQYFDLRGMAVCFDAACASGFVGLHNAIEALNEGSIEQAIVCSANIPVHPTNSFIFLQMQMLSPTGYSRFLDSRADGYVKSEACVSMLIQRNNKALRNYASFMTTMTSVDGYKKEGITFPSDKSQESLIRAAKKLAGLTTNHIQYIEAHGTGTPAGDPQEANAIASVYFPPESETDQNDSRLIGPLLVGSVKTNMGHSEAASGLCSLTKAVFMLENEIIYKGLNYEKPNKNIESLIDGRLMFVEENMPLKSKIIPLSCYGFGGSNVHVVIRANNQLAIGEQDKPGQLYSMDAKNPRLVLMFGRSEQTIEQFFNQMLNDQDRNTKNCLTDDYLMLLDSLSGGKIDRLMDYRGFMILDRSQEDPNKRVLAKMIAKCPTRRPLIDASTGEQQNTHTDMGSLSHFQESKQRKLNLILPGLGSQWPAMAAGLTNYTPFWSTIERLIELMEPFEDKIHLHQVFTSPEAKLTSMTNLFVGIVSYQIALIKLVREQLCVQLSGLIVGHSLGEISCAYASGVLTEREALVLAFRLGQTLDENQQTIAGKMLAVVGMNLEQINELFVECNQSDEYPSLRVSCINGPRAVTLSGRQEDIDRFRRHHLDSNGDLIVKELDGISIALHNELIMNEEIEAKLTAAAEKVLFPLAEYKIPNTWRPSIRGLERAQMANASFFAQTLCKPVDLLSSLESEQMGNDSIYLELGPSALFGGQLRQLESTSRKLHIVSLMKRPDGDQMSSIQQQEWQTLELVKSIGKLYQAGVSLNLSHFYKLLKNKTSSSHQTELKQVRRKTPSIGALFKWNHEQSFFVPRYPNQFSKSSAKFEMPIDLLQERDEYLSGHCIEGRVLFPATGYLFLIWRAFSFTKRQIYDSCFHEIENDLVPIEFHNVRLLRAVILGNKSVETYVHLEEATGRFEIKEGGSVVVEGWVRTPDERPNGLLYEDIKESIKSEKLETKLTKGDVYKQFRVSGYDYGPTFQCIEECSLDGRYSRIEFNGHFISLTDSILQTIFLAVSQYAPSGGLFLPTRFEYVRFQPEIIRAKLGQFAMKIDLSDNSLNIKERREVMTKIMQREQEIAHGKVDANSEPLAPSESQTETETSQEAKQESINKEDNSTDKPKCIFETFCDPITGVIVTDGIEMRGIKAMPAPRRHDQSEVMLESYQFVPDIEEPLVDEPLTQFERCLDPYVRACDSMATKLVEKHFKKSISLASEPEQHKMMIMADEEMDHFARIHLKCLARDHRSQVVNRTGQDEPEEEKEKYDIKHNGNLTLLSVLDQLLDQDDPRQVRNIICSNENHILMDLVQTFYSVERVMRPLAELVLENCCQKQMKLKTLEVNLDDIPLASSLQQLLQAIEHSLSLDYSLAHPDPNRVSKQLDPKVKTFTLKPGDPGSLFKQQLTQKIDLIVYKDASCFSLPKAVQPVDSEDGQALMTHLARNVRPGGFLLMAVRNRLTLAERVVVALSGKPELLETLGKQERSNNNESSLVNNYIEQVNSILAIRYEQILTQAAENNLVCISKKSESHGCAVVLFKRSSELDSETANLDEIDTAATNDDKKPDEIKTQGPRTKLIRVQHRGIENISTWLEELKNQFRADEIEQSTDDTQNSGHQMEPEQEQQEVEDDGLEEEEEEEVEEEEEEEAAAADESELANTDSCLKNDSSVVMVAKAEKVWLCAVATRDAPISGLIGMMQALRRELGSSRLRCYHDQFTFKDKLEHEISLDDIEQSAGFQTALERDLLWSCIDENGRLGAYRHITINNYLNYSQCLVDSTENKSLVLGGPNDEPELATTFTQRPPAYVNNLKRGDLSSFAWFEGPYKYLKPGEQLVQVCYSALNFRDIMLATGRLPLDAIPLRAALSDCLLGLEFSGIDGAGKRVMGMIGGRGLATHVLCPPEGSFQVEIPDWMSLEEAASIPVVYATALMALIYRGRMKAGESILIHAGSGGVGQAAIRLCLYHGLTVYTTVGTPEKRQFLLQEFANQGLKDEHIMSSRDCKFETQIMRLTRGRGVDLILNSLADDKLQASIRCLADGGRFLEIGKYDLSVDTRLELPQLDTNKTFHGILLDKLFDVDQIGPSFRQQLNSVMDTLKDGLQKGYIKPIKRSIFKSHQVEEAFRYMATGKHIGKVLIEIQPELERFSQTNTKSCQLVRPISIPRFQLSPSSSYIVTGGLGGFGLELVKWLVAQGARHLVLSSRTGVRSGYQRACLANLQNSSEAKIELLTSEDADAGTAEGATKLICKARELSPESRVGGIFHLAMVLKDTMLDKMSPQDFELVCRPKLQVAMELDQALERLAIQVDLFVAFSSISCGKGNAGQSNYAYANSCLERIVERRRARGQHGLAIQWGAIGDVGVAFENLGSNDIVIGGTVPQRMPSCLATLGRLLCSPFATCLSVVPVRGEAGVGIDKTDLAAAVLHVLGIKDPSKVSEQATLAELGLDSLMAVEIRQYIEREYDLSLNIQEIRSLTIAKIREIGEKGKPSQAELETRAANVAQPRQAASYGSKEIQPAEGEKKLKRVNGVRIAKSPTQKTSSSSQLKSQIVKQNGSTLKQKSIKTNGLKTNGSKQSQVNM